MEFQEFAHILFSMIGAGDNPGTFTRRLFEEIVVEDGLDVLDDYADSTFRSYYSGRTSIQKLATKILKYIEQEKFAAYIKNFPDAVSENLCNAFKEYIPDIDAYNFDEKLMALFNDIIVKAARSYRSKGKKTHSTGGNAAFSQDILAITLKYKKYLETAYKKYSVTKTLLCSNDVSFNDIYVCNNIYRSDSICEKGTVTPIKNVTAKKLQECADSNFISLTANGGMGKSMMMRHLLLDAIDSNFEKIPILIALRDFNSSSGIDTYIFKKVALLGGSDDMEDFIKLLSQGKFLILLDGLDEINSDCRWKFKTELLSFSERYKDNMFILSSRPVFSFKYLEQFEVYNLCPFEKFQAIEAIEKLNSRTIKPSVKKKFISELKNGLFESHKEFAENPLLLTIMFMSYGKFNEIPSKKHLFYWNMYVTLFQKHDEIKPYKRTFKTQLTLGQFAEYLAKFCAESYYKQKLVFDDLEFNKYFSSPYSSGINGVTAADFQADLVENVCLMLCDGGEYYFIHRSIQEFFCALYTSNQDGEYLRNHISFFDSSDYRGFIENTFEMLSDMVSEEKMEKYIFEPVLSKLFKGCDAKGTGDQAYFEFLLTQYPWLYCLSEEIPERKNIFQTNKPASCVYDFIIRKINTGVKPVILNLRNKSVAKKFLIATWKFLSKKEYEKNYNKPHNDAGNIFILPMECLGSSITRKTTIMEYKLDIDELLWAPDQYKKIIEVLRDDNFAIKAEYLAVRKYWQGLVDKYGCSVG